MAKEKFEDWVHVKITDEEISEKLDAMVESDKRDRSKMVRWLIEQEWRRRNGQAHLFAADLVAPIPVKKASAEPEIALSGQVALKPLKNAHSKSGGRLAREEAEVAG